MFPFDSDRCEDVPPSHPHNNASQTTDSTLAHSDQDELSETPAWKVEVPFATATASTLPVWQDWLFAKEQFALLRLWDVCHWIVFSWDYCHIRINTEITSPTLRVFLSIFCVARRVHNPAMRPPRALKMPKNPSQCLGKLFRC